MTRTAPRISGDDYVAPTSLPYGPGTVSWEVTPLGFLGSSRALLLQTSHPKVAAGVAQHSDYQRDPFGRAFRTFDAVLKLSFAEQPTSRRQSARMDKRHRPVTGTTSSGEPYDARDPALMAWVWATLTGTALQAYELVHGRLQPVDRTRYYEEQKLFARGCNVPADRIPDTIEDFEAYMDRVVASDLERTPEGDDVAKFTFHPIVPPVLAPAIGWVMRWTAAAMFPPRVRAMYGLEWNARRQRRFDRFLRVLSVVDRAMPDAVRMLGVRLTVRYDVLARLDDLNTRARARRKRRAAAA